MKTLNLVCIWLCATPMVCFRPEWPRASEIFAVGSNKCNNATSLSLCHCWWKVHSKSFTHHRGNCRSRLYHMKVGGFYYFYFLLKNALILWQSFATFVVCLIADCFNFRNDANFYGMWATSVMVMVFGLMMALNFMCKTRVTCKTGLFESTKLVLWFKETIYSIEKKIMAFK